MSWPGDASPQARAPPPAHLICSTSGRQLAWSAATPAASTRAQIMGPATAPSQGRAAPCMPGCSLPRAPSPLPSTASGKGCPVKPKQWTPLEEQCRYKYILHLPGISDWLEHFKHQLACGSVNIFIGACQAQISR